MGSATNAASLDVVRRAAALLDVTEGADNLEVGIANFSDALLADATEAGPQFYRTHITGFSAEAGSFDILAAPIGGGDYECRLAGSAVALELTLKAGDMCVGSLARFTFVVPLRPPSLPQGGSHHLICPVRSFCLSSG